MNKTKRWKPYQISVLLNYNKAKENKNFTNIPSILFLLSFCMLQSLKPVQLHKFCSPKQERTWEPKGNEQIKRASSVVIAGGRWAGFLTLSWWPQETRSNSCCWGGEDDDKEKEDKRRLRAAPHCSWLLATNATTRGREIDGRDVAWRGVYINARAPDDVGWTWPPKDDSFGGPLATKSLTEAEQWQLHSCITLLNEHMTLNLNLIKN